MGEDYELSSVGRYAGFVEVHVTGGGGAHQLALFVPGHHPDAFQAAAEEEIEHESGHGEENQGYDPCERAYGIAVFPEHHNDAGHNRDYVCGEYEPVHPRRPRG